MAAAQYLRDLGYQIIEQNWRTRYCEIDIVASKDKAMYFVEVKYRSTDRQGTGFDYITPQKLRQMSFAAELWASTHRWQGAYQLMAVEVAGEQYKITTIIELTE